MKLALLLAFCLLAGAFNAARAQAPPPGNEVDDGGSYEGAGPDDDQDGGSFEGDGLEDGEDDGGSEFDDPNVPEEEDLGEDAEDDAEADAEGDAQGEQDENQKGTDSKVKSTAAAGHGGYHRRRHPFHHRRPHRGWGGYGYGRGYRFFGRRRHNHAEIDRSTCSVQASYFLSFNGQRRYCRHATNDHDDCQACCEAATRRETRGADKDDIIGFITLNVRGHHGGYRNKREAGAAAYDAGDKGREPQIRKWECVCCIPKHGRH